MAILLGKPWICILFFVGLLPPAISKWVCLPSEAHAKMVHKFQAATVGFIRPDLDSSKLTPLQWKSPNYICQNTINISFDWFYNGNGRFRHSPATIKATDAYKAVHLNLNALAGVWLK